MKEKLKDRFLILAMCFLFFGAVIVLQLVNLQIIQGKKFDEESRRKLPKEKTVIAPRGNIVDRYGVPIAINRQGYTVNISKTDTPTAEFNEALLRLVEVFEKNGDVYNKSLSKYLTVNPITFNGKSLEEIKRWQMDQNILGLKEEEVMTEPEEVFKYLRKKFEIDDKYTDEEAYKIMTIRYEILLDYWKYFTGNPITLASDVSVETVAEIEEKHHLFPGVTTDIVPIRKYIDAHLAANVIGYVGNIRAEQYEKLKNEGYGRNDIVGQTGIELAAERDLRGKNGLKKIETDTSGRQTEEISVEPAIPGNDVVLTLDMNLQKVAMESLERNIKLIREKGGRNNFGDANAGAVVALNVHTGEVLVMASYPGFDPALFLEGAENKEAQKKISQLFSDNENKPMLNRAIQEAYAPGSTFKPLVGIAALEEGVITPDTLINDTGRENIGNWNFYCLEYRMGLGPHGKINLSTALATSCNIFFHVVGYRTGIDKIDKWAKLFGLGEYTGIDIPGEVKGMRANRETKRALFNDDWRPADTAQASIGQFNQQFTPLQLANYISAIANGGKLYKPYLIKKVVRYDGTVVRETKPEYQLIPVKPETISAVQAGMVAVANSMDGTAVEVFKDLPFKVAGKTGTAETGREATRSSNALFVCYAPADDPEIAVAVVVEHGAWGANTAPIARDILVEYFKLNGSQGSDDSVTPEYAVFTR